MDIPRERSQSREADAMRGASSGVLGGSDALDQGFVALPGLREALIDEMRLTPQAKNYKKFSLDKKSKFLINYALFHG